MNTENIPQEGSKWEINCTPVQVVAVSNRGRPPGKQVKWRVMDENTEAGSSGLKKFLKAAKPL